MMGGSIDVESDSGQGSQFIFKIPFDRLSVSTTANKGLVHTDANYSDLKVLLAEDNEVNQLVALGLMTKLGVKPDLVADGLAAVDMACQQSHRYDLILMDCEMPILDGYEATRKIRQYETDNDHPPTLIYALSAHVLSEHIGKCHEAGMDDYMSKPFSLNQLEAVLSKVSSSVEDSES